MPRTEELSVRAGDVELAATLTLPDAAPPADRRGRYPNVLLLGSWLPRTRDGGWDRVRHAAWFAPAEEGPGILARLAETLAAHGVASLRCDPRGCGASEGVWESTSLFTRIDDARDALGAMRSRSELDLSRAGILGHGEGAAIAMSVAIGDPAIGALTLVGAAARSYRDVLRRGVAERGRRGIDRQHRIVAAVDRASEELIELADRGEAACGVPLDAETSVHLELDGLRQAFGTPPRALITMLNRSLTLVHGADDAWVDPSESELLLQARPHAAPAVRQLAIPGAGHDLAEVPDATIDEIAADLAARLEPRELPPVLIAISEMS
ncbi:MAG: alpha/beta hydrolase [Chloroflexota bacterium]